MNNDFARVITLLRKEKKLSQKQAAQELGVSQALLSHYEKGIRECGLDFVVRAAEYYGVSCDYLLGRTTERSFDDSRGGEVLPRAQNTGSGVSMRLIGSSMNIIFDRLSKIGSRRLTRSVTDCLMLGVYRIFHSLYAANPENPVELFAVPRSVAGGYAAAMQEKLYTDIDAAGQRDSESCIPALCRSRLSPETLVQDYPGDAAALFNMILQAENVLKKV